jgi:hypothetical protein
MLRAHVPDFPLRVSNPSALSELERVLDREAKIPAALESLGADSATRLLLVRPEPMFGVRLTDRLKATATIASLPAASVSSASADVMVAWFDAIAPNGNPSPDHDSSAEAQVNDAQRILDHGGRLLVVHDYGRDEITPLEADPAAEAQRVAWSRPKGWFLSHGFKVRVLHCWLTFDSIEEASDLLGLAFDREPASVGAGLRRPRLEWKVAVYHRTMGPPA